MMAIKKASMCARVTSTYMEFTFTFGPKPEFKFSFNLFFSMFLLYHMQEHFANICSAFFQKNSASNSSLK